MKKTLAAVLALLMFACALFAGAACAEQSLTFRTGPGERYGELFTLPLGEGMSNKGIETVDGVEWMLVEFTHDGKLQRAYAQVGGLDVSRDFPNPELAYLSIIIDGDTTVYAAPSRDSTVRGTVQRHRMVNYLSTTTGDDGEFYDFIEFYDKASGTLSRGYVTSYPSVYTDDGGAVMRQASPVYRDPSDSSGEIGQVGALEIIGYREIDGDYTYIQFYSASAKDNLRGYVPTGYIAFPDIQ